MRPSKLSRLQQGGEASTTEGKEPSSSSAATSPGHVKFRPDARRRVAWKLREVWSDPYSRNTALLALAAFLIAAFRLSFVLWHDGASSSVSETTEAAGQGHGAGGGGGSAEEDEKQAEAQFRAMEELVYGSLAWRYREGLPAGYLYGWTDSKHGYRIGWPDAADKAPESDSVRPVSARRVGGVLTRLGVKAVSASLHTLAITEDGILLSFGQNWDSKGQVVGQLGRGGPFGLPGEVRGMDDERVVAVAAGMYHSVAVTESGRVFTWGLNSRGQLGRWPDSERAARRPGLVLGLLEGQQVVSVAAGPYYTLAVTDTGAVFTWGANWYAGDAPWTAEDADVLTSTGNGAGGGANESIAAATRLAAEPRRVGGMLEWSAVAEVDCSVLHWVGRLENGSVFTCSTGFSAHGVRLPDADVAAQTPFLGRSVATRAQAELPGLVPAFVHFPAISVAAAADATFAVTSGFQLFSWGHASPVLGRPIPGEFPEEVPGFVGTPLPRSLRESEVVQVVAAETYAMARTKGDDVFTWGRNEHGQLGRSTNGPDLEPQRVAGFDHIEGVGLAAGSAHALAICHAVPGQDGAIAEQEERDLALLASGDVVNRASAAAAAAAAAGSDSAAAADAMDGSKESEGSAASADAAGEGGAARPLLRARLRRRTGKNGGMYPVIIDEHHRKEIEQVASDAIAYMPPNGTDKSYRNPCWSDEGDGGRLTCAPYFIVAGAARSGTLDLFLRLTVTDIGIVPPIQPITEWWDLRSSDDFGWYLHNFSPVAVAIEAGNANAVTGEVTPSYLTHSGILARGPIERDFVLPELIYAFLPTVKIIIILRNPIYRWLSTFLMDPDHTVDQFADQVGDWLPSMEECLAQKGGFACVHDFFHISQPLCRSMYAYFLTDWLKVFPREQILILRFEDYKADVIASIKQVLHFLSLPEPDESHLDAVAARPIENRGRLQDTDVIDEETRERLERFFEPHNRLLANITGDARFLWTD